MVLKRKASSTGYSRRVKARKQARPIRRYRRTLKYRARYRRGLRSKTRRLARSLRTIAETKVTPCNTVNEDVPLTTAIGSQTYYHALAGGQIKPVTWTGSWNMVDGYGVERGSDNNQLDGQYAYLKKTYIDYEVCTTYNGTETRVNEFRTIIGRMRRTANPAGNTKDPGQNLFLQLDGRPFGYLTSGFTGLDMLKQPTNKRDFVIIKDTKYILSAPQHAAYAGSYLYNEYHSRYPARKVFRLNMNYFKKIRFPQLPGGGSAEPDNVDFHWFIVTVARHLSRDGAADDWEVNFRGVTSWNDL